jgi:hypothetical protein
MNYANKGAETRTSEQGNVFAKWPQSAPSSQGC